MFIKVEKVTTYGMGEEDITELLINTDQIVTIERPRRIFFSDGRNIVVSGQV